MAGGDGVGEETHFGFEKVRAEDKAGRVAEVFSKVAARYDVMNDVMSGGLHRLWKDNLVAKLGPIRGSTIVDLAGGTGDVSFRILDALREQRYVPGVESRLVVCDINAEMLQEGRRRAGEQGHSAPGVAVEWVQGDAEALPFPDRSVDALTIAFGLRNVTRTLPALKEVRRVLRRGGRFLCMEFSQVEDPSLRALYDAYSFSLIPRFGGAIAGDPQPYQYLVESIRQFHDQRALAALMEEAGMRHVTYDNILNGVVAVHSGFRLD